MKKRILIISLFFIAAGSASSFGADFKRLRTSRVSPLSDTVLKNSSFVPSSARMDAFKKFNIANSRNKNWRIRFNTATSLPESIVGDNTQAYSGSPEEIFSSFINQNPALLGVSFSDLKLFQKNSFNGVSHLQYRQYYKDLPVEFSYVRLHVSSKGEITGYQAKYYPGINLNPSPSITAYFAENSVRGELGYFEPKSSELVVFPEPVSGNYYLAWKIRGRGGVGKNAGLWVYYVDASSGKILFNYDDLRYACSSPYDKATGTVQGMVYDISPAPLGSSGHPDSWTPKQKRVIENMYVWLSTGTKFTTDSSGEYCSNVNGKVFASIKGPYFSVSNYKSQSSYFTNGGPVWTNGGPSQVSPNPYANSMEYSYNVSISDTWSSGGGKFAFAAPYFSSFRVGSMDNCGGGLDGDTLHLRDMSGNYIASYIGNRANFTGAYVENPNYNLLLKTDESGTFSGFNMTSSKYMIIPSSNSPNVSNNLTGSILWSTKTYLSDWTPNNIGGGEINAFYHLNKIRDYFMKMNMDSTLPLGTKPVDLTKRIPVMVHVFGDVTVPDACTDPNSMYNAFYDLDHDNIFLGDGPQDNNFFYRDFSLDGTIIRHEYTHLLVNRVFPIINFGEFGALSEAMADYFSLSSFWNDGFDVNILGSFVGAGEATARDLSSSVKKIPDDWIGEVHDDSLIISPALYKIRKDPTYDLGYFSNPSNPYYALYPLHPLHRADFLAFAALFYFPDNFSNYLDAMLDACKQLDAKFPGDCNQGVRDNITSAFSQHGITSAGYMATAPYEPNNGPEWATDISTFSSVTAYIDYPSDMDYYAVPLNEGVFHTRLYLPAGSAQFTYHAYSLYLFNDQRIYMTEAVPEIYNTYNGYCPDSGECLTLTPYVDLYYDIPSAGRYYLDVSAGPNVYYDNCRDYDSSKPYRLEYQANMQGAAVTKITSPAFDADEIEFTVKYPKFSYQVHPTSSSWNSDPWKQSEVKFEYAELLDNNMTPLEQTKTNDSSSFLSVSGTVITETDTGDNDLIRGKVKLKSGFSARYPGVGTVYLKLFGSNHLFNVGQTNNFIALGISNPINLTANQNIFVTYNNIINSFNPKSILKYETLSGGDLTIKVYTSSGSPVKTIFKGQIPAGKGSFEWDGTNDSGAKVSPGVYFVKAKGPGINKVDKVAIIR